MQRMSSPRTPALPGGPTRAGTRARLMGWFAASGMLVGACIGLIRGVNLGPEYLVVAVLKGMVLGTSLAVTLGGLEQIALRGLWRRLALGRAILVRTALYAPLATGVYVVVSAAFSPWIPWGLQRKMILPSLGIAVTSLLVASAVVALNRLLGFRVLRNLASGRYHRPFEEERIFLFLDLVGSTTIAERIGHLRYHAFLHDFIEDLEDPLLEFGGDVYQYVGDEVVVTWPLADVRSNGRCIACHFAIVDAIERARGRYEDKYGVAPTFRTGIHSGRVVAGEIGDQRKQIVFVGDVVNTASRVQAEAKAREKGLVVSGLLLARTDLPPGVEAHPLGVVQPKGKEQAIELFEVVRSTGRAP
jgi:adenylate cyclase